MRKGKATKLTGFQCPLELRKCLDEEFWITRVNISARIIKLIYEHYEKKCGPEFMEELQKKADIEDYSNIRLPDTLQTDEVIDDITTEAGWENNFINTAFIESEIKKIMNHDSSVYDKRKALGHMDKYFKACIGVVEQNNNLLELELGKQKELFVTEELI